MVEITTALVIKQIVIAVTLSLALASIYALCTCGLSLLTGK